MNAPTAHPGSSWWEASGFPPAVLILLGTVLLATSWSDAVQVADSGELITTACQAGVAHPPGYPLYVVVGHLFCQLPWSTPAGRLSWLSGLAALVALLALYGSVVRLTRSRWAGVMAGLVLATGSIFWRQASVAEVFSLNAALSLTVVYLAVRCAAASSSGARIAWSGLGGLGLGLALSNHHSSVLVAPAMLLAVLGPPKPLLRTVSRCVVTLLGIAIGLLPYLQLLLADPARLPRWGDPSTLPGLVHHVLRRDYGTFTLLLGGTAGPLENVGHYLALLPTQTGYLLWIFAAAGCLILLGRAAGRPLGRAVEGTARRDLAASLVLLPLLAGPGFMLLFNIRPEGIAAQVAERFHVLPNSLLAIWIGVGLAAMDGHLRSPAQPASRSRLFRGAVLGVIALGALASYPRADARSSYTVEDYARNTLASVERGALVLGTGDVPLFSILYAQQMLHLRPDVQYIDVRMLLYPWYVAQKRRERPGLSYVFRQGSVDSLGLIQAEMQRGVPVYLIDFYNRRVATAFGGFPVGPLIRLLPPGAIAPGPRDVYQLNDRLFRGFADRGRRPEPERDPWAASLVESYARTWQTIGRSLYLAGDRQGALRAAARARDFAPWQQAPQWLSSRDSR